MIFTLARTAIMPIIGFVAASLIFKIVIALGATIITFQGLTLLLETSLSQFTDAVNDALPEFAAQLAGKLRIDICINILVSAYTVIIAFHSVKFFFIRG